MKSDSENNEERKKGWIPRLSIKILLLLFIIVLSLYLVIALLFSIFRASGLTLPRTEGELDLWMRGIVFVFPIAIGTIIVLAFGYAVNVTLVARIRKLKDATKEVARGNFDIKLEVIGGDEISELTESFRRMTAELKANEYLSKEFVKNVSHEFKTPLSVIRAYAELLETEAAGGTLDPAFLETVKAYAAIITAESDRMVRLSRNALELSLLDSTTMIKKEENVCPAEQIRDILRLMHFRWHEKKLTFDLRLDEVKLTANAGLLYQVWQNLLDNAIKYTMPGGTVKITLTHASDGMLFEIADNGIGIRDGDKDKIFNQFFMADKAHNGEGSGLGLPIVKSIVEKLGGGITFESAEGRGTTFRVKLKN